MKIFVSAGVGDFIAVDSYMTKQEKESVVEVWLSTPAIADLLPLLPYCFPNCTTFVDKSVKDSNGVIRTFESLDAYKALMPYPAVPEDMLDCSIAVFAEHIRWSRRPIQKSSFAEKNLCDISSFSLPDNFVVLHPCSTKHLTPLRDLTTKEWVSTMTWLNTNHIYGVMLNNSVQPAYAMQNPMLVDLTGKTSLVQSLEIMKKGYGFVGASSCLSVLASRLYSPQMVFIKGHSRLKTYWTWFYYGSQFNVTEDIKF